MKLLYFISFLFFLSIRGQNYTTQSYTMDSGLPQNSIKDIVKDKYGFIWLSMEGRILRYDGSSFVEYKDFKFKNLSFGDFYGNINKDSIVAFNASEKNTLLISRRKPGVITSGKIMKPGGSENNKVYKQLVKNNITVRYVPYIDSYFIRLDTGSYYFENNRILYVDQKSRRKTKIDLEFPHSQLKRLFVHGEHVFIANVKTKKLLHLYKGKYSYIDAPPLYTDSETKMYWQQITGQVFIISHGKIYKSQFTAGKLKLTYLLEYKNIDKDISGAMFYDETLGKLYIGSSINGLKILSLSDFSVSRKNLPYQDEVCYAAIPYGNNSVLTQEGIRYYNTASERIFPALQSYDKRYILEDESGNLVYRENNSIHTRYKSTGFIKHDSVYFKGKEIHGLYKSGGLYMASVVQENYHNFIYSTREMVRKLSGLFPLKIL